jgi:hypothetical protein
MAATRPHGPNININKTNNNTKQQYNYKQYNKQELSELHSTIINLYKITTTTLNTLLYTTFFFFGHGSNTSFPWLQQK